MRERYTDISGMGDALPWESFSFWELKRRIQTGRLWIKGS